MGSKLLALNIMNHGKAMVTLNNYLPTISIPLRVSWQSRIAADAMTTQRSYNVPLAPIDAVTMMKEKLINRYDPEMLKALYSVLFKLKE